MAHYAVNKLLARTRTTKPTVTDQSQASATDLNVIVKRFGVTGNVKQLNAQPIFGQDTTSFPQDLKEMFDTARALHNKRAELPEAVKHLSLQELLSLTDKQLADKLTPPQANQPPAETPKDEKS